MRCHQLFVLFFLLVHGVASLPTPPPGLLTSAKRSHPESRPRQPRASRVLARNREIDDVQSARSAVSSELSMPLSRSSSPSPSVDGPVANGATPFLEERSVITLEDDGQAGGNLLPRAQPARNWKRPLMGIGILGAGLTAFGGLASYTAWRRERDRRKKEEQARAQPPEVQHGMVQAPQDGPWCMGC